MVSFGVSLVARTPRPAGPPLLVEVDRLVTESFSYADELNRPGSASLSCKIAALTSNVKDRLVDLARNPCEVWVYADSAIAWAGEVRNLTVQDQSVTLNAVGLLGYLDRAAITADTTYTATDQWEIGRSLVTTWQAKSYANYGLVVGSGNSGTVRDRTYLGKDLKGVLSALMELAAMADGFDVHVDPTRRRMILSRRLGRDLTESVVLDSRTIDEASVAQSVAPEDLVSDAGGTGQAQDAAGQSASFATYRENPAIHSMFGRTWRGQSYDGVTTQADLDGACDAFLAGRSTQLLQPGLTLVPNVATGVTVGAIQPGDSVSYAYDAGLGLQSGTFRVAKVTTSVGIEGKQRIGVEFT